MKYADLKDEWTYQITSDGNGGYVWIKVKRIHPGC